MRTSTPEPAEAGVQRLHLEALLSPGVLRWLRERGCADIRISRGEDAPPQGWHYDLPPAPSGEVTRMAFPGLRLEADEATLLRRSFDAALALTAGEGGEDGQDRLPDAPSGADTSLCLIPRAEFEALLHDLRNRLNSLLMNAGLVCARATANGVEGAARFSRQVERDGGDCAEQLRRLGALLPRRTPPSVW